MLNAQRILFFNWHILSFYALLLDELLELELELELDSELLDDELELELESELLELELESDELLELLDDDELLELLEIPRTYCLRASNSVSMMSILPLLALPQFSPLCSGLAKLIFIV